MGACSLNSFPAKDLKLNRDESRKRLYFVASNTMLNYKVYSKIMDDYMGHFLHDAGFHKCMNCSDFLPYGKL